MKLKNLIITLGLSLIVGAGIAVAVATVNHGDLEAAEASTSKNSTLYMKGVLNGVSHWDDQTQLYTNTDNDDIGFIENVPLKRNDCFRFCTNGQWEQTCGWTQLQSSEASGCFYDYGNDNNIKCKVAGTYNFYINKDKNIYVTFATAATYSYVLSTSSTTTCTYIWDTADSNYTVRAWSEPQIEANGQAYDLKWNYNSVDYYGLYRIDDRILKTFNKFLMRNSGGTEQSGDIGRTANNTQELYIWNGTSATTKTSSSNEYKAAALVYDILTKRGSATYDNFTFAYSVCAASKDDATSLVNRYDNLGTTAQSLLATAYCNTYNMEGNHSEDNKTYQTIPNMINGLRAVANRPTGIGSQLFNLGSEDGQTAATVVVIVGTMSVLTAAAYFFFKKSKKA